MGKRAKKPRNKRSGPQNPAARERLRTASGQALDDEAIPMTYQGRIITPQVIEEMRAERPEDAHQLDGAWARMVLENNRPWLEDEELLRATEQQWQQARALFPDSFADCGCQQH